MENIDIIHGNKIFVTGASGFIGRHLIPALIDKGWQVYALYHMSKCGHSFNGENLKIVNGDINELSEFEEIVSSVDAICHLAAFIPFDFTDPGAVEKCFNTNTFSTFKLAELVAKKNRRCRFINFSSSNAYVYSSEPVTEDAPLYPAERASYYLTSKLSGEILIEHLRRQKMISSVTFRLSSVYGHGMPANTVVARFMENARIGMPLEVWDGGVTTYDLVYIGDIVNLILSALSNKCDGVFNAGSGRETTVLELANEILNVYPEQRPKIIVKPVSGKLPANFPAISIKKAAKNFCYMPRSLYDGLIEYRKEIENHR